MRAVKIAYCSRSKYTYTYDAEGSMVAVDGGSTAKYGYDASNHRVRFEIWGGAFEELYNLTGQKVVIWNAGSESVVEEDTHLGTQPLAVYLSGSLFFEHQDWLGTERVLTDGAGNTAGSYLSLPFGDGFTDQGTDLDPYHFAGLDHDYESGLDHGQFREYSSAGGRWLSPDPYSGSYDWSNPQSLNRYAYALNNPLSMSDPTGEDGCGDDFDWEDDDFGYGITGLGDSGGDSGLASGIATPPVLPEVVPCGTTYCMKLNSYKTFLAPLLDIVYPTVNSSSFGLVWSTGGFGGSGPGTNLFTIPGTNWCGPGGAGAPTTRVDGACKAHDTCYNHAGVSWRNNVGLASTTPQQSAAIATCDSILSNALHNIPWPTSAEVGQATIVSSWFNLSSGYSLNPGLPNVHLLPALPFPAF